MRTISYSIIPQTLPHRPSLSRRIHPIPVNGVGTRSYTHPNNMAHHHIHINRSTTTTLTRAYHRPSIGHRLRRRRREMVYRWVGRSRRSLRMTRESCPWQRIKHTNATHPSHQHLLPHHSLVKAQPITVLKQRPRPPSPSQLLR